MCCCGKPNTNGTPYAYSWDGKTWITREPSPPAIQDGDVLIYDEPGRCGGIDAHSHHFRLVKRGWQYLVLVRHGAGEESVVLGSPAHLMVPSLAMMDSDARYWLLHSLYSVQKDAKMLAECDTAHLWRQAAAEGRIKTRKQRGQNRVNVWIEPAAQISVSE